MTSDYDKNGDRWTVETLRTHLLTLIDSNDARYNTIFDAQEKAVNAALLSAEQAVRKAENASEKRFDNVNEFRASLSDQQRTFMPRAEVEVLMNSLDRRLDAIEKRISERISQESGARVGYGSAVAIVGVILVVLSILLSLIQFWRH